MTVREYAQPAPYGLDLVQEEWGAHLPPIDPVVAAHIAKNVAEKLDEWDMLLGLSEPEPPRLRLVDDSFDPA